ncbi:MAG: hypothetical protein WBD47_06960 [Phormidesmis sp.]
MIQNMPRRFTVTLPDTVAAKLDRWSEARGQAFATAAAAAIELQMKILENEGEIPPEKEAKTAEKEAS